MKGSSRKGERIFEAGEVTAGQFRAAEYSSEPMGFKWIYRGWRGMTRVRVLNREN